MEEKGGAWRSAAKVGAWWLVYALYCAVVVHSAFDHVKVHGKALDLVGLALLFVGLVGPLALKVPRPSDEE